LRESGRERERERERERDQEREREAKRERERGRPRFIAIVTAENYAKYCVNKSAEAKQQTVRYKHRDKENKCLPVYA